MKNNIEKNCEDCVDKEDRKIELNNICPHCDENHSRFHLRRGREKHNEKVVNLNGDGVSPQTQKEVFDSLKKDLPFIIEYVKINAQITRENYLALLKNHFTEQQALYICSQQPLMKTGGQ